MRAFPLMMALAVAATCLAQDEPLAPPDTGETVITDTIPDSLLPGTSHVDTSGSPRFGADTILFTPPVVDGEASVTDTINFERHLRQNPTAALVKSLAIPGWGQVGNGRYVKAAIFVGLDIWFIGEAIHYGRQASDFKKQYDAATSPDLRNDYYSLYADRRQERNKYFFFLGLSTLVGMFDAYVDAHLSGSPVGRDRAIAFDIGPAESGMLASLRYRF